MQRSVGKAETAGLRTMLWLVSSCWLLFVLDAGFPKEENWILQNSCLRLLPQLLLTKHPTPNLSFTATPCLTLNGPHLCLNLQFLCLRSPHPSIHTFVCPPISPSPSTPSVRVYCTLKERPLSTLAAESNLINGKTH